MNENLDPTTSGYNSEEFDLEKKMRPLSLMILLVKIRY
jgi:Holliday junction DNA helicase RuvB